MVNGDRAKVGTGRGLGASPVSYGRNFLVSDSFTKWNNFCEFLFAFLKKEAFPKWGLPLTSLRRKAKIENGRIASPESVPSHFKQGLVIQN